MITEIKTGDIIKIGDQIGIVEKINTTNRMEMSLGKPGKLTFCLQVDAAAVRAKMPDSAMRILTQLASGAHIRLNRGRAMPVLFHGTYIESRVNALVFEIIRPYLVERPADTDLPIKPTAEYSIFDLNDDYWADFCQLRPGDPVEVWIDKLTRPDLPNRTGVTVTGTEAGLYWSVEIDGAPEHLKTAALNRSSLRRVFKTPTKAVEAR